MDVEVFAFSECFLFFILSHFSQDQVKIPPCPPVRYYTSHMIFITKSIFYGLNHKRLGVGVLWKHLISKFYENNIRSLSLFFIIFTLGLKLSIRRQQRNQCHECKQLRSSVLEGLGLSLKSRSLLAIDCSGGKVIKYVHQ